MAICGTRGRSPDVHLIPVQRWNPEQLWARRCRFSHTCIVVRASLASVHRDDNNQHHHVVLDHGRRWRCAVANGSGLSGPGSFNRASIDACPVLGGDVVPTLHHDNKGAAVNDPQATNDPRDRLQNGWWPPLLRAEVFGAQTRSGETESRPSDHEEEIQKVTPSASEVLSLQVADGAKGFLPDDEAAGLHKAAVSAPEGVMLEVGSYCGKSAVHVGVVARTRSTLLFSVDHHRGSEENQSGWEWHDAEVVDPRIGKMDTLPFFRATIHDAGLEGTVVAVVGESAKIGAAWRTPLAFCFIDGGHGRAVAHCDFDAWVPHVQPGGLLAIHDVFPNPNDGGRPPYELYLRALAQGFDPLAHLTVGSLRVLRRPN